MHSLFKPYSTIVKTRRKRVNIVRDLKTRASFQGDRFKTNYEFFSFHRGTIVVGLVESDMELTTITFTVYPSDFFKIFSYLFIYSPILASITLLIVEMERGSLDIRMFVGLTLGPVVMSVLLRFIVRLMFRFSAYLQEESIKGLIST